MSDQATYQAGFAALQAGDLAAACGAFEAVLAATPRHVGALTYLGVALARRGDYPTAEERLRLACQLDPTATLPHYNLGRLLQLTSRPAEAGDCFRTVLRLDRRHAGARRELAALAGSDPLLAMPPQGDLAVMEIEPANALLHALWFSFCLALPPIAVSGCAVLLTGETAWWWPGVVLGTMLGGGLAAMVLCVLAGYPLLSRRRAPVVLELQPDGRQLRLGAIDAYAVAKLLGPLAVLFALLFVFVGFPMLGMSLAVMEATNLSGEANRQVMEWVGVLLAAGGVGLLPLAGCSYLAAMALVGGYNLLAQRLGGVRGRHAYHVWYSEWAAWDIGASWLPVSGTLLPAGLLTGLVLAVAAASSPLPVLLCATLLPPLAALFGPPVAMVLYNGLARKLGGIRLALVEE